MRKRSMLNMFVAALVVAAFLCVLNSEPASAQTDEVSIWRLEADEVLLNRNVRINPEGIDTNKDTVTYRIYGITEVSHEWISSDEDVLEIKEEEGKVKTIGKGEGLAKLILRVTATDGNTYEDYAYVSSYREFDQKTTGTTQIDTMLYRHAGDDTDYRNERGTIPAGKTIEVTGVSKNYFRVNWTDYSLNDNVPNGEGYVKRSSISVEPTDIEVTPSDIAVPINKSKMATATLLPEGASSEGITWSSANTGIANVNSTGNITGKKQGVTKITAKLPNGSQAKATASVYEEINEDANGEAKENTNIYAGAYKGAVVTGLNQGDEVKVLGICNSYYYVSNTDGKVGFVEKTKIKVHVQSIYFDDDFEVIKKKQKETLILKYIPKLAKEDNPAQWSIVSGKGAKIIDANKGKVEGVDFGSSVVRATVAGATEGNGTAEIRVWVRGTMEKGWTKVQNVEHHTGCGSIMQGMCGLSKKVYFVRVDKEDKYAILYTGNINGDKIENRRAVAKITGAFHINSMEAVNNKNKTHVTFYMTPYHKAGKTSKGKDIKIPQKGYVTQVTIPNSVLNGKGNTDYTKLKKYAAKRINVYKPGKKKNGKKTNELMENCQFSNINKYGKRFVLKAGGLAMLFEKRGNALHFLSKKKIINTHTGRPNYDASKAGGAIYKGYYYLVFSFVKKDSQATQYFKELRGMSYITRYKISTTGKQLKLTHNADYEFVAENNVTWKNNNENKKNGYSPQLEMEDVYIYKGKMYFNSEGGNDCIDLLGKNK